MSALQVFDPGRPAQAGRRWGSFCKQARVLWWLHSILALLLVLGMSAAAAAGANPLPAGTILYVRLKTLVSTASSKVNQQVTAEVVRQVFAGGNVVVPIGAQLTGEITKLHSSQNANDPALMVIHFTRLTLPGEKPMEISCHLTEIENARETIEKDGTIQGVLPSSLGATYLNNAFDKLAKQYPSLSSALGSFEKKQVGTPDASISYPANTDMQVALDKSLGVGKSFSPAAAQELPANVASTVSKVLAAAPQRSATEKGTPGDPINLVIVGNEQEIRTAFGKAGWDIPAARKGNAITKTVQSVIQGVGDNTAPISNLYVYKRPQDLAFEKVLNTFAMRHHVRFWKSPNQAAGGNEIWLGAAVHDTGYDIHPGVASHATSPVLDDERAKVGADLLATGLVSAEALVTPPRPLSSGFTGTGGAWHTDGKLLVIVLK